MMRSLAALSAVLLAASTSASSVTTIPLTKLQRTGAYLKGAPDADRARAALLRSRDGYGPTNIPATNLAYVQYTANVGIGSPPTYYNLIVDTGSSNIWCGSGIPYNRTSTSIPTGEAVNATYGIGNFMGLEYLDQVTLAPNLVITNQSIGDALSSADYGGVDGIIGVGPVNLTKNTLSPDRNATIPTVVNNLASQGLIKQQVLGVYFAPATNSSDTNGVLTFGGTDPSLYEGKLTYVSVTETYPAGKYWGINVTSAIYGNHAVVPTSTAGIVDTGTTQVLISYDLFDIYQNAIPGASFDQNTGLIEIPPSSVHTMHPLRFLIGGREFIMDVASQLVPTDQNVVWGGIAGKQYGVVGPLGNPSGGGFDFIIGQKFMERYYTVFDTDANRVGFARTKHTFTTYQE